MNSYGSMMISLYEMLAAKSDRWGMGINWALVWNFARTAGAGAVGVFSLLGVIVAAWIAFELPRIAWSTDINRLDRAQLRLSIAFERERSTNILEKQIIVEGQLIREKEKPKNYWNEGYIATLNEKLSILEKEELRTEEKIRILESKALELEREK